MQYNHYQLRTINTLKKIYKGCGVELESEHIDISLFDEFKRLYQHNRHSTKTIIKNRKPKTFLKLYEYLKQCDSILNRKAVTVNKYKILYGDKWEEKWEEYRQKQAHSNTFEYKKNKGIIKTQKEFDEYNKSRAVTLKNCIKRHGEQKGKKIWNDYCQRQAFTNSKEYLGDDEYKRINFLKGHSLESYIFKYGDELGRIKYENYMEKHKGSGYSKVSQELFSELSKCELFKNTQHYYYQKNKEYGLYDDKYKKYRKYDFVCLHYNICIEFNGDDYHGNPNIYKPGDRLKGRGR